MRIGIAKRSLMHDSACGDQCDYWCHGQNQWLLCMLDGLGHGMHAETAALAALDHLSAHLDSPLEQLFADCNQALRQTRGAAMSLLRIYADGSLDYAAIGNTQARLYRPQSLPQTQRLVGNYGIVGGGYRSLVLSSSRVQPGDLLILHTDGISDKFDLHDYDESLLLNPAMLASCLLSEWGRSLDDAAVMVCLYEPASPAEPASLPNAALSPGNP